MQRLTKTYSDGTFGVADDLPCGENSHEFKKLLIDRLGMFEEARVRLNQYAVVGNCENCKFQDLEFIEYPCTVCDRYNSEWKDGMSND